MEVPIKMIKKQQKWIALLVAVTFIWLLQVSAMPLAAENSGGQASALDSEQGPGYLEAVSHHAAPPAKKSILPLVLIGVGVVAVAAVLVLVVFKTSYDIVGNWTFVFTGYTNETHILSFSGSKKNGTCGFVEVPGFFDGNYTVDGKDVAIVMTNFPTTQFVGKFTGKDAMSGTWVDISEHSWTWTATRNAASPTVSPTPLAQSALLRK